jgi:hypothetical protein
MELLHPATDRENAHFYLTPKKDDFNQIPGRLSGMPAYGRLPSATTPVAPISEGQLLGESGHSKMV